ncbi:Membrane protein-like protein TMS1 [Venustampulla echinocandica]|uniref:Membrane protein-like protein TMS1 n=1 Tax=Venustampulla echinocandica TaxID=2656787 RepID=A0A370TJL7_9HELO|nr:Membrane protein-like protein TMS1 [Venustampulla echinocandica]RDL35705.1 Membrane protein-like protein TMS1 [Venustampulla echinocandica]
MGALLSLPLLAVPSVGTRGDSNCLRPHPASELDTIVDNAYAVGDQQTTTFDPRLYDDKLWGWRVSWMGCGPSDQLRPGRLPHHNGRASTRVVLTFLIPESFFAFWGNYVALFGATLFLLLGLILLVDLAHSWAEYCLEQIDATDSRVWRGVLIGSTLGMYAASLAMTIVQYIFFAASGCSMNQTAITLNLVFLVLVSGISVHPAIQEYNPKAGLAQSAMVAVYCTYLTMSAVSMEPDDKNCNPLIRAQGARTTSVVIGAIVTMLTVAYTTTRAATQGVALGGKGNSIRLPEDDEHDLVTQQPDSRREMRAAALRQAVEEGSLPADALLDDDDDSESGNTAKDDERTSTQYNYALFHIIFFLATAWVATLLTMNMEDWESSDFAPVGRTYWASWVKIVSAWVCYGIYIWTLVAPIVLPDRFDFS